MADNTRGGSQDAGNPLVASDEVTYSGDTADVQLLRNVHVTGNEGAKITHTITNESGSFVLPRPGFDRIVGPSTLDADEESIEIDTEGAGTAVFHVRGDLLGTVQIAGWDGFTWRTQFSDSHWNGPNSDPILYDGAFDSDTIIAYALPFSKMRLIISAYTSGSIDVDAYAKVSTPNAPNDIYGASAENTVGALNVAIDSINPTASLAAGNNNIGDVDIASLPNEGQQTMANSISVAIASNQSAVAVSDSTAQASLATIAGDTTDIETAVELIDDTVQVLGTDTYTETTSKGITVGAVRRDADTTLVNTTNEFGPLQMDANGRLKVEAFSGETLPVSVSGVSTLAEQQTQTTHLATIAGDTTDIEAAVELIDDTVQVLGTDTYTEATSKGLTIGAVRRDADTTLVNTTNEFGPLQMDANGRLKVEVFSGESLPTTVGTHSVYAVDDDDTVGDGSTLEAVGWLNPGITGATAVTAGMLYNGTTWDRPRGTISGSFVQGGVGHDFVDAGNPNKIGGKANDSAPTQVANADRVDAWFDRRGAFMTRLVDSAGSAVSTGVQYVEDASITADAGQGTLVVARRDDALSTLTPAENDAVGLRVNNQGALWVAQGSAIPAGTNNIGDVDVLTMPNVTVIGTAADGAAVSGNPVRIAGKDGSGNTQDIATDTSGELQVDVLTLPANASTNLAQIGGTSTLTGGSNGSLGVGGLAAHASPTAGNPVYVAGRASNAIPTDVGADGDAAAFWTDRSGALIVSQLPHVGLTGSPFTLSAKTVQQTTSQTGTDILTPTSGKRLVVTSCQIQAGATTAATVQVWFGANADTSYTRGTDLAIFDGEFAPSSTLKPGVVLQGPFIASAADHEIHLTTSANITITVTVWYYEI